MSVEFWAEFFQAAGLEPAVAASYANIFFVNKIQLNHLPDIDRDALREMKITPMGDILTILKYIKLYCTSVTSPATASGNEQMLLHQDDALKCNVQLRNLQDSKSGFCGQNQFECGAQHSIEQAENSFLSHYLHSTDILDGSDIPPTTVHESPLNLTVHGKFCNTKKSNEHCNSVNSTVSCDTSEATSHMYSIALNKREMVRSTDGLNNLERNKNISYVNSCEQQSVMKEKIIIPGRGTPQQKRSVFDRLGQRSDAEKIWVKSSFKQFSHSRHFKLCRQKCTPQRDNGVMRSNHLRKKWHCSPIADDQMNNNIGSINTITMDSEPLSALQVKCYNEDINKEAFSASRLNIQEVRSESSPGNSNKQLEVACNENLNDAGTSDSDRNSNQENSFHEQHSVEDISQSLTSRISLPAPQDGKTSRSASENKLSQETVTIDPDAVVITHTPQNEDPELESLRDPTLTHHSEQFYLAWADRRKQAQLFPGFKPSFLQES